MDAYAFFDTKSVVLIVESPKYLWEIRCELVPLGEDDLIPSQPIFIKNTKEVVTVFPKMKSTDLLLKLWDRLKLDVYTYLNTVKYGNRLHTREAWCNLSDNFDAVWRELRKETT